MKVRTVFLGLIALTSAKIYVHPDAAAECGELGVMEWELDDLHPGCDIIKLRKCCEHPVALLEAKQGLDGKGSIEKRACYNGPKERDCDKGYCWGKCYQGIKGAWCWWAWDYGEGSWVQCNSDKDCNIIYDKLTTWSCGADNCKACGCSC